MASIISLFIPLLTSYLSYLAFQIFKFLSLALILALTLYCFCWVSFDISLACSELTEGPNLMVVMYFLLGPLFMDLDAVLQDLQPFTYTPAMGPWIVSVLAFLLWALPDWVVAVDSDRFLGQFDVFYVNDPYVLHSRRFLFLHFFLLKNFISIPISLSCFFAHTFPKLPSLLTNTFLFLFPQMTNLTSSPSRTTPSPLEHVQPGLSSFISAPAPAAKLSSTPTTLPFRPPKNHHLVFTPQPHRHHQIHSS